MLSNMKVYPLSIRLRGKGSLRRDDIAAECDYIRDAPLY